ncbi:MULTISPECIES: phosphoribosylaminoimidazolesuccinocarboxamide synthase [unclassified Microbacterium]|uniref:phosphoribosylaminoimidazolesuccinocarboxamide synthase n=1 Tax=unclassified Microbacterium TaxID=2609290 RepID=UPI00214AB081|nr:MULTISPECIES: phosphoribosylaminoimidazolesuccinocarboxamide synthase [unclassified Microbacterium]MCR2782968.1 phosphoribosylaminoimidazolesuccinocarboxamide synthase [Microbacterium sp. zg.B96]WIM16143.1 phosphoribosylaminoimidazolesuccinocarboxamide synthase [Microbacterium sp. zg-B96]
MTFSELPGWRHVYSGKVRDLYVPEAPPTGSASGPAARMLVVASDRVSAFDFVLEPGIPGKGVLLTTLSLWWFDQLAGGDGGRGIPNHLAASTVLGVDDEPHTLVPDAVAGRAMVVRSLEMLPVECVVRGYLTGSGWAEYREHGTVCGIALPAGLGDGDRLPEPIFTPAYKAPIGEHDENISFDQTVELVGRERAEQLRDTSLEIYSRAAATAEKHGLILADTKFEFGVDDHGILTLADEVLTSDSSRYWDAAAWHTGTTPAERMASFDKQIVRDWLAANWSKQGTPPPLPAEIVQRTAARYRELLERLTG